MGAYRLWVGLSLVIPFLVTGFLTRAWTPATGQLGAAQAVAMAAIMTFLYLPVRHEFIWGQVNGPVLLLTGLGAYAYHRAAIGTRNRPRLLILTTLCFGLVAALKVYPILIAAL